MFENENGWPSYDPQPASPAPEPETSESVPQVGEPVTEPDAESKPKGGRSKGKGKAKRPAAANPWTVDRVHRAREVFAVLDDPTARNVVASVANAPADDPDRLAVAVLKGGVGEPVALLVRAHDESDAVKRTIMLVGVLEKDNALIRQAARVALALDPGLGDRLKPQGGSPMELATVLAQSADGLNVDPIRPLGE